ncbi:MAG: hypothetical protein H6518_03155 [Microthrixaceae bacterium]|nr:hypothetical protein [Microthrixaceae bacterium]
MRQSRGMRRRAVALALAASLLVLAACSGGDGDGGSDGAAAESTATTTREDRLYILVTNGEGTGSAGLAPLVDALFTQPGVSVGVAAPDSPLVPPPALAPGQVPTVTFTTTPTGYPAVAVAADSADTVRAALSGELDGMPDDLGTPDLVVAGVNTGQLIGSLAEFSSNVPAARAAAAEGIPALVVAQGVDTEPPEYTAGAAEAVAWLDEHRDAIVAGDEPAQVTLLNVPSCATGEHRGVVEVPIAADDAGRSLALVDCASTAEDPADDVAAFTTGYATLSVLPTADGPAPAGGDATTTTAGG